MRSFGRCLLPASVAAVGVGVVSTCTRRASSSSFSSGTINDRGNANSGAGEGDAKGWIRSHMERSVASGRQSPAAAAYFESLMEDEPELLECVGEARRLMGDQDPEKYTSYQKGQFADRLSTFMSARASKRLMRAHQEDEATKKHTQDGTATGEDYWFEAGNSLSSPSVPSYVKDDILKDMRANRPKDSSAFRIPSEEEFKPSDAAQYAQHLREKRRQLLSDTDLTDK